MKKKFTLFLFAFLCFAGGAFAAGGGPDAYGYVWRDSNEPNGPVFSYVDITNRSGVVQVTGLADDNAVGPFALGWDFHYYWSDYSEVKIGSNGWIGFDNIGNIASCFPIMPDAANPDNFIAPYMSDLNFAGGANPGAMYYWSNNVDSFIIQYENVPWWVNATPDYQGDNNFQVILSGVDSSITFQYLSLTPNDWTDNPNCAADMEIGIENLTGNIGLECWNETIPPNAYSIKFYYPSVVTFQVQDASPLWNANSDNSGQFYVLGSTVALATNIANVGNTDISTSITINGELQEINLNSFWTDNTSLSSLTAQSDTTVEFPNQVALTQAGQFNFNVETVNASDINPSNNTNTVEISVVECVGDRINLTYVTENDPDGTVGWAGGGMDDGIGVYFEPPVYPVTLESVEMYFLEDGDTLTPLTTGYQVAVYDQIGAAPLDSFAVPAASALEQKWQSHPIASQPVFTSGGFYVGWFMGGPGVAIGTESIGPKSQRAFEILGGSWAPYRSGLNQEVYIRATVSFPCSLFVNTPDLAPEAISLRAYPNPADQFANISYELPNNGDVQISVIDINGRQMLKKDFANMNAGEFKFSFNTSEMADGLYFVRLESQGQVLTQRLIVSH